MSTLTEQADEIVDKLVDETYYNHIVGPARLTALVVQALDEIRELLITRDAPAAPAAPAPVSNFAKVIYQGKTFRVVADADRPIAETFRIQWSGGSMGVHFTVAAMIVGESYHPEVTCKRWAVSPTSFEVAWWGSSAIVPEDVGLEISAIATFATGAATAKDKA